MRVGVYCAVPTAEQAQDPNTLAWTLTKAAGNRIIGLGAPQALGKHQHVTQWLWQE